MATYVPLPTLTAEQIVALVATLRRVLGLSTSVHERVAESPEFLRCYAIARGYWACHDSALGRLFATHRGHVSALYLCGEIAVDATARLPCATPLNPRGAHLRMAVLVCAASDPRVSPLVLAAPSMNTRVTTFVPRRTPPSREHVKVH